MRRRALLTTISQGYDYSNYMTIEALADNVSIIPPRDVLYTTDGVTWNIQQSSFLNIKKGTFVSFCCELNSGEIFGTWSINGNCNLRGNCNSLIFGHNAARNNSLQNYPHVFEYLFNKCTSIVTVEKDFLPAIYLSDSCYKYMFSACTNLISAPNLPALKLEIRCYWYMFSSCTNLKNAPILPALELESVSYSYMFNGCLSLNYIKALFINPGSTTSGAFVSGVSRSGTFVKNINNTNRANANNYPSTWDVIEENVPNFPINISLTSGREGITITEFEFYNELGEEGVKLRNELIEYCKKYGKNEGITYNIYYCPDIIITTYSGSISSFKFNSITYDEYEDGTNALWFENSDRSYIVEAGIYEDGTAYLIIEASMLEPT